MTVSNVSRRGGRMKCLENSGRFGVTGYPYPSALWMCRDKLVYDFIVAKQPPQATVFLELAA